jgi:hypothetical protein
MLKNLSDTAILRELRCSELLRTIATVNQRYRPFGMIALRQLSQAREPTMALYEIANRRFHRIDRRRTSRASGGAKGPERK